MKIQIKSDLHKETRPDQYTAKKGNEKHIFNENADLLVLAGDITNWAFRFNLFHELTYSEDRPIIYVPGNHEYYRTPHANMVVPELQALFRNTNVSVLDRGSVIIDGIEFVCATLWSEIYPEYEDRARIYLNDFRNPGLTTEWYKAQHEMSVDYLETQLKAIPEKGKRVVVTHHSPSFRSSPQKYEGEEMNCCFHTNLHHLMSEDWAPELWIHGHTHDPCDYVQGNTRVVCNPKGYPNEHQYSRQEFPYNDDLIITI
jgi:predicted phosphodiesterase